jgi:2-dehydro-3-deoxyglucarate aldolase/4-hydroxy-2-oxoheptanedioate aldolase
VRENSVKAKLQRGELALGTMVFEFASPGLPAILGTTGIDFAIYDMEHTGVSLETLRMLTACSRGAGPTPMTRVPAIDPQFISHALDVGCLGVMCPNVETPEQAATIVAAAKYPPVGKRGAAFGFGHDDYERGPIGEKAERLNDRTLLIAQIESPIGLRNLEAIAGTDGIDVLWVGHNDLTLAMGIPGQFEHPDFQRGMDQVAEIATKHGKAAGFMVDDVAGAKQWIGRGYRMIGYSCDFRLMATALQQGVQALRGG